MWRFLSPGKHSWSQGLFCLPLDSLFTCTSFKSETKTRTHLPLVLVFSTHFQSCRFSRACFLSLFLFSSFLLPVSEWMAGPLTSTPNRRPARFLFSFSLEPRPPLVSPRSFRACTVYFSANLCESRDYWRVCLFFSFKFAPRFHSLSLPTPPPPPRHLFWN